MSACVCVCTCVRDEVSCPQAKGLQEEKARQRRRVALDIDLAVLYMLGSQLAARCIEEVVQRQSSVGSDMLLGRVRG